MKKLFQKTAVLVMALSLVSCGVGGGQILSALAAQHANAAANGNAANNNNSMLEALMQGKDANSSKKAQYATLGAALLSGILSNMNNAKMNANAKEYTGAYTAQLLVYKAESKGYVAAGKAVSMTANSAVAAGASALTLSIPAVTAGNAQMTKVTITNLTATDNVYGLSDNSTCLEGKLTFEGKTFDLANAYIQLSYSPASVAYTASIYFDYNQAGDYYNYAMNVTFKSAAQQQ